MNIYRQQQMKFYSTCPHMTYLIYKLQRINYFKDFYLLHYLIIILCRRKYRCVKWSEVLHAWMYWNQLFAFILNRESVILKLLNLSINTYQPPTCIHLKEKKISKYSIQKKCKHVSIYGYISMFCISVYAEKVFDEKWSNKCN